MINDNNDMLWPRSTIDSIEEISPKTIYDLEPYQQKVILSCKHICYNTYGNRFESKVVGNTMGCRNCYINNYEKS